MILVMLTSGCSDPSPLRSHVEVQINQTFGTKFGLIDQLIIKSLKKNEIVTVLNPEHFSNSLGKMKKVNGRLLKPNYAIYLKTSKESEEYRGNKPRQHFFMILKKNTSVQKIKNYVMKPLTH
jgi:hypothetical protein